MVELNAATTSKGQEGVVGGAQYQRMIEDNLSFGAQIQTNETILFNLGIDF